MGQGVNERGGAGGSLGRAVNIALVIVRNLCLEDEDAGSVCSLRFGCKGCKEEVKSNTEPDEMGAMSIFCMPKSACPIFS